MLEEIMIVQYLDLKIHSDLLSHILEDHMHLLLYFGSIRFHHLGCQEIPFRILSCRIPDHSSGSSYDENELVSLLHVVEGIHEGDEIPELERIR